MTKKGKTKHRTYQPRYGIDIVRFKAKGMPNTAIADRLGISPPTVQSWMEVVCKQKPEHVVRALKTIGYEKLIDPPLDRKEAYLAKPDKVAFVQSLLQTDPDLTYYDVAIAAAPNTISDSCYVRAKRDMSGQLATKKPRKHSAKIKQPTDSLRAFKCGLRHGSRSNKLNPFSNNPKERELFAEYSSWVASGLRKGFIPILADELRYQDGRGTHALVSYGGFINQLMLDTPEPTDLPMAASGDSDPEAN